MKILKIRQNHGLLKFIVFAAWVNDSKMTPLFKFIIFSPIPMFLDGKT